MKSLYYPFGMMMPGRKFAIVYSYRYGFQTQEKSLEIYENSYTAEFWEYDSRSGRRWNRDPKPTIEESEYAVDKNDPVNKSDPKGDTPGDGVTGTVGVTVNMGSHNNKVSLKFTVTGQTGNWNLTVGGSISYNGSFNNTGKSGVEYRASAMGGFDDGKNNAQLGTNFFGGFGQMAKFKQQTGILAFKVGQFSASYENDGYPFPILKLGDNGDRYRTAAVRIGIGEFSAGFNLFTGLRPTYEGDKDKIGHRERGDFGERMPNGFVVETGPRYRMGAAYVGYGSTEIGLESDRWIRHAIQDNFAHNLRFPDTRQPGFRSMTNTIRPYLQIQRNVQSNSILPKRMSLFE